MGAWWAVLGGVFLALWPGPAHAGGGGASAWVEDAPVQLLLGPRTRRVTGAPARGEARLRVEEGASGAAGEARFQASLVLGEDTLGVELERLAPAHRAPQPGHLPRSRGGVLLGHNLGGPDGAAGLPPRGPPVGRVALQGQGRVFWNGRLVADRARVHVRVAVGAGADGARFLRRVVGEVPGLHVAIEGLPPSRFPRGQLRFSFAEGVLLAFDDGVLLSREGVLVTENPREHQAAVGAPGREGAPRDTRARRLRLLPRPLLPLLPGVPEVPAGIWGAGAIPRLGLELRAPLDADARRSLQAPIRGPRPLFGGPEPLLGGPEALFGAPVPLFGGPEPLFGGGAPLFGGPEPLFGGVAPLFGGPEPLVGGPRPLVGGPEPLFGGPEPLFGGPEPLQARPLDLQAGEAAARPFRPGHPFNLETGTTLRPDTGPALEGLGAPSRPLEVGPTLELDTRPRLELPGAATLEVTPAPARALDTGPHTPLELGPTLDLETGPVLDIAGAPARVGEGTAAQEGTPGTPAGSVPGSTGAQPDAAGGSGTAAQGPGTGTQRQASPVVVPLNAQPAAPSTAGPVVVPLNAQPPPGVLPAGR